MDAHVLHRAQHQAIPFSGHDGAQDLLARLTDHVGDDVGELDVHLRECLLHVLHIAGLPDLKAALDGAQVYSPDQVQQFAALFLAGAERDQLDPILDACVAAYTGTLDEDQQVDFKGKAKVFCRTYDFLASVMPGTNPEWEKLSILLNLLVSKLPAPWEEDLAKGILEAIDMDSYRVGEKALMKIALADTDAEIAPKVAADKAFQNARDNTPHTARMAHDQLLGKVMQVLLKDDTQVYKQFVENESFRRFVGDMVYQLTSSQ